MLVLSAYDDEATVRQLRQAGACGHLVKGTSSTDLTASILAAAPDGTQGR